MRPGDHQRILTISELVRDAAAICDPAGADEAVTALFEAYEDDDRPATAAEDLLGELLSTARNIDPEDGAVLAAAAAAAWLSTNPGQADAGDHVLREGARLAFKREPPEPVNEWLAARGVQV